MPDAEFDYAACLDEVRGGDQAMAAALVEALHPLVMKIVRAHLPHGFPEEDLAQETFMKMFARLRQYRGEQPFPHWVSRLAVTTCVDRLRSRLRRPELRWADLSEAQAEMLENTLESRAADSPAESLAAREIVEALLGELDPKDRLIVNWLDIEQLSVAEIRERTGWGASFIKVRAMRARLKLRKCLHKYDLERRRTES